MRRIRRRLYWIEYAITGPIGLTAPFEAVGFETKRGVWGSDHPNDLTDILFPGVEAWQPDIIVFWMSHVHFTSEPAEWVSACQMIRSHPQLHHTKIMAFFGIENISAEQDEAWRQRYDFYTQWPFRPIEHAQLAKQLIGEEVKGYEGVNYYLVHNGNWELQDYLDDATLTKNELRPDANGRFAQSPKTRLLKANPLEGYAWNTKSIQAKVSTDIVFAIKDLQTWQGGLRATEIDRLKTLAQAIPSDHQLLIGVNDLLIQAGPESVGRVLEQAQRAGGWQIFLNEHLWFEGVSPLIAFSGIVYEKEKPKLPGRSVIWYGSGP